MPQTFAVDVEIDVQARFYVDASSIAEARNLAAKAVVDELGSGSSASVMVDMTQDTSVIRVNALSAA